MGALARYFGVLSNEESSGKAISVPHLRNVHNFQTSPGVAFEFGHTNINST